MQGLTKLSNIGRCDQFGEVMEYIAKSRSHAPNFQINYLHTRDMTFHQVLKLKCGDKFLYTYACIEDKGKSTNICPHTLVT